MFVLALDDSSETMCPKYNIVGPDELDNYELARTIAEIVGKPLVYEFVDFHSSRPGHDLRYAISGEKLKRLGWVPKLTIKERLAAVVEATKPRV
jgi:dTDP-glucose 4,6-dehydratase